MYECGASARRKAGPGAWLALSAAIAVVVLMIGLIVAVSARSGDDDEIVFRSGSASETGDDGGTGGAGGEDPTGEDSTAGEAGEDRFYSFDGITAWAQRFGVRPLTAEPAGG